MWTLGAITAVVILVGLISIRFTVEYSENGFLVCVRILFFKITFPEKHSGDALEKDSKKKRKKKEQEKKQEKRPGSMNVLVGVLKPAFKTFGKLMRMLCIRKLIINIRVASNDAFLTAMIYGKASAGIGVLFPFINNNLRIKKKFISVKADFEANEASVYLFADISIRVWQIFVLTVYFLYQYIKRIIIINRKKKGLENNG